MLGFTPVEDWQEIIDRVTSFITDCVREQNARGVLLGISGGIDSAVVAALAVKALGPDRVHACLLPDIDSGDDMLVDAQRVVEWLGLTHVHTRDISPVLKALGAYDLFPDIYSLPKPERIQRVAERKRALLTAGGQSDGNGSFMEGYRQRAHEEMNRIRSLWNVKIRCRMVILYSQAELHKLVVLGTTNKSEYLTGWFTKYGDGAVDVEVILPLYKTRVFELAEHLGVPEPIRHKVPTGDILPGVTDEDMLGVRYPLLDRILLGLERQLEPEDISAALGTDRAAVDRVAGLIASSRFSRMGALAPELVVD